MGNKNASVLPDPVAESIITLSWSDVACSEASCMGLRDSIFKLAR
jgi:hypothetical protein